MRNFLRNPKTIIAISLAIVLQFSAIAQNKRWGEIKKHPLTVFDWNCTLPSSYPQAKLKRIVQSTMKRKHIDVDSYGDRAFVFDLNKDRKPEYFVPLSCGTTGNCTWGVFALNPTRFLGMLGGQFIYIHSQSGDFPDIITYTHMGISEGILATYNHKKHHYIWSGDKYSINVMEHPKKDIPDFLTKAHQGCSTMGR